MPIPNLNINPTVGPTLKITSPDGLTTKELTLNNSGNLFLNGIGISGHGLTGFKQVGTSPIESWYLGGVINNNILTTGLPTGDTLMALPFVCSRTSTLDRIAINVTVLGVASAARIGIYQATSETNLYPNARIVDSGELDTSSAGIKSATISTTLQGGTLYWLVFVANNSLATISCLALANLYPIFGLDNAFSTTLGVGLSVSYTFAALPSTFPGSATVITAVPIPAIAVRLSA
jgi:hypothetical protein